ncbi:MAG: hypothetical protein ACK5MR_08455 [Cumulibacter sp.]
MRNDRTDRVNRVVLCVIGLVLVLLGIGGLLHSTGALGGARRSSPVVSSPTAAWYASNGSWVWPTIAGVALIVVILAVWWASAQIRMRGSSRIELERAATGTVSVAGNYLAECIELDAATLDDIERARARVSTTETEVHVWLTIWVGPPYDVGRAVARVTKSLLPNVRAALDGQTPPRIRSHVTVETAESAVSRLA